jgi:hypothetical protein
MILLIFLALISQASAQLSTEDHARCSALADSYLSKHHKEASPFTGSNMVSLSSHQISAWPLFSPLASDQVYFLHVPRTAGRTFHSCMLKTGVAPSRRCPRAYDHLRIANMSMPNCDLLSSHDDFSVVSMLPDDVSVLSHIRDPVDRFLSAYEFAVEVAARTAFRPKTARKNPTKIATEDVWPWSYLVPFFANDLRTKNEALRDAQSDAVPPLGNWVLIHHPDGDEFYYNKVLQLSKWELTDEEKELLLPPLDPYDNPIFMGLLEFTKHPIAAELLHNGQTFQVLGITNYSHWGDAAEFRKCVWDSEATRSQLITVATNRIDKFMHVGSTGKLEDSVAAAAAAMKFNLNDLAYVGGEVSKKKKREYTHYDTDGEYDDEVAAEPSSRVVAVIDWLKRLLRPLSSIVLRPFGAVRDDEERGTYTP